MKYLFDFDGVLTNQIAEAKRVSNLFEATLYQQSKINSQDVKQLLTLAHDDLTTYPHKHGWVHKGRIAAYANEDFFMQNVGLSLCLDSYVSRGHALAQKLCEALSSYGFKSFFDVAQKSYVTMVSETQANLHKPINPETRIIFDKIISDNNQIVIVSNSSTERILDILRADHICAVDHNNDASANLRVRGSARKFDLADEKLGFYAGNYWLDTARPGYSKIIHEEKPQVFVGDVLSLDLATPYFLATNHPEKFGVINLYLKLQDYTPSWSKDFITNHQPQNATFKMINQLREII